MKVCPVCQFGSLVRIKDGYECDNCGATFNDLLGPDEDFRTYRKVERKRSGLRLGDAARAARRKIRLG